jgi:GWxTD domain-containing protein
MIAAAAAEADTVGRGDFELFLDTAAFRAGDGGTVEEVYLRMRNSGLRFKKSQGKLESRIRLILTVSDAAGKPVVSKNEEIKFYETKETDATSALRFHTVTRKLNLEPGSYELFCFVEDLNSPKVSLVGIVRGDHKGAVVEGYPLSVPQFPTEVISVSDAKFLWDIETEGSEQVYHPNPPRLYGLYRDSLRVYVESYVPVSLVDSTELRFEMEVLDQKGELVKQAALSLPKRPARTEGGLVTYPIVIQEDLNTVKAGNYTLYLNAGLSDQLMVRMRAGGFSVAWDLRTWEIPRRSYLAEARFLLSDGDFGKFEQLSMGEQEKAIQEVWKGLDPDPSTGVNEAYQKFLARLEYANARYSDYQTGILSDRGLIYLKYGPPDEVEVDVVPQNRESLSDALERVDDKYHPINYSNTGARLRFARPGQNIFVDPKRLGLVGEQGDVGFPYELWTYNGGGDPILERDQALEPDIGLRFIFIDTEGYGRYKLETSSSMLNK